ncbi:hypothetical protein BD414DRAFT_578916 [Trametes punicea]|nr:hypothetical protein BD414DRAFT_578916 [Trametes punicea]
MLGIPTQNYTFSSAFGPLSKIGVIVIIVHGRHHGLPVAMNRAILLPEDLKPNKARSQADHAASLAPVATQFIDSSGKEKMNAV